MDEDIRDMFADDDLFDPFEEEEEDQVEVPAAPADDEGVVPAPVAFPVPAAKPELPPEERIANLLREMPGQKKLLLRVIDHCREAKTGEDMDAFTLELQRYCYSVYTPVVLRELLEEAGAIEYVPVEDEADGDGAGEGVSEGAPEVDGEAAAGEGSPCEVAEAAEAAEAAEPAAELADAPAVAYVPAAGERPLVEGGVLISVDESKIRHETLIEGDTEMVLDYLEVEEAKPGLWLATPAGLAAVDAVDSLEDTRQLLAKEPQYLDIYHQILDFCAQEKYGRSSKEIDNLVNDSPLLEKPRRYSGYFVSRLERQGALEWRGGWCVTEVGRTIIDEATAKVAAEAAEAEAAATAEAAVAAPAAPANPAAAPVVPATPEIPEDEEVVHV